MIICITTICCMLLFNITIAAVYFLKQKVDSVDNRLYTKLIIATIIGLIIELLCNFTINNMNNNEIIRIITPIVNKSFIVYLLIWEFLFTEYVVYISFNNKAKFINIVNTKLNRIKFILYIIMLIISMILIILPLYYYNDNIYVYSYGLSTDVLVLMGIFFTFIDIASVILNRDKIKNKQYFPLFVLIFLMIIVIILRNINPGITLINSAFAFVTVFMYFTIENPDVKMIEQLNVERDRADKANNAKTDFLSSMSHEIRTPLNAIVGFSQALSEEDLPPQAQEEVKDIVMASETLLDIVNGILDISKIEADKLEIVNTEYNFNDLLNELVALSKARIGEKPLEFRHNFSPDIPKYMYGDKVRVKQVILNLLTNAIKYTKEGWIEFKVNCVNKNDICRLIISVQDTGMGIKQENINKLFNRFERLDIEKNNTIEGTGLGLAITKKLINLMGGQIVVQSIYGEGSKFTIAIDQKIVTTPTNPALEKTQELAIGNLNLTNKRILIVDDNKINLKVAARLLQDYHCIIDMIDNGADCIEKIKIGASYDLILMDDMMPKMSGVETFHHLQEIPDFKTPVIALTANAISGMREKYLAEGFDDYLSKPIDKTELNKVLNKYLG